MEDARTGLPKDPWVLPAWDVGQRLQAVSLGWCPENIRLAVEGEHFTGEINFLLTGTKQPSEELDTASGSNSSENKQVKHTRSISLQRNV